MPGPGSYWIGEEEKQEILDVLASGHVSKYGDLNDPNFRRKGYTPGKGVRRLPRCPACFGYQLWNQLSDDQLAGPWPQAG